MRQYILLFLCLIKVIVAYPIQCSQIRESFGDHAVSGVISSALKLGVQSDPGLACQHAKQCLLVVDPLISWSFNSSQLFPKLQCPSDCHKRGVCVAGQCICSPQYAGEACQTDTCKGECSKNGLCFKGKCLCSPGFFGEKCDQEEPCPYNCHDNGICRYGKCQCNIGRSGDDCSVKEKCRDDCNGKGVCSQNECFCFPGYSGGACESKGMYLFVFLLVEHNCPKSSNGKECSGLGQCDPLTGKCKCQEGSEGLDCSIGKSWCNFLKHSLIMSCWIFSFGGCLFWTWNLCTWQL